MLSSYYVRCMSSILFRFDIDIVILCTVSSLSTLYLVFDMYASCKILVLDMIFKELYQFCSFLPKCWGLWKVGVMSFQIHILPFFYRRFVPVLVKITRVVSNRLNINTRRTVKCIKTDKIKIICICINRLYGWSRWPKKWILLWASFPLNLQTV